MKTILTILCIMCALAMSLTSSRADATSDQIAALNEQIHAADLDIEKWQKQEDNAKAQYDMALTVANVGNRQLAGGNRNLDIAITYWNHCTNMRAAAMNRKEAAEGRLQRLLQSR